LENESNRIISNIQVLLTKEELDITEMEWSRFLVRICVFTRPKRKKKAMMIISTTATKKSINLVECRCCARYTRWQRTRMGTGLT
jgi:hypothetical protein